MKEIRYTDRNKYKELREISSNYIDEHIELFCDSELLPEDIERYIFYGWNRQNNFYYALTELTKIQLTNFYIFKDFFKGIVIKCTLTDNEKTVIKNFCDQNNKEYLYEV